MSRYMTYSGDSLSNVGTRLFGLPYQFPKAVDPRVNDLSKVLGKKYLENIVLESPVCTIIPGKAKYLPGTSAAVKRNTTTALLDAAGGNFSALTQMIGDNSLDDMRLFDFERDYTEYMKYVNVLCRTGAGFLNLEEAVFEGSYKTSFQKYDWRDYRWNNTASESVTARLSSGASAIKKFLSGSTGKGLDYKVDLYTDGGSEGSISDAVTDYNYVQFYVDSDITASDSMSNSSGESQMKSLFSQGESTAKEIAFMANTGGFDATKLQEFTDKSMSSLQEQVSQALGSNNGALSGILSRLINLSSDVVSGNNIIIPDIYQSSSYDKDSANITVHLKSPYGTRLGYYLNVFVPMMHLLALALPRQASANSYGSPFLVKIYIEGVYTCNLGIIQNINFTKVGDAYSVDGLPMEVDVTLSVKDLYSDLSMSSASEPLMFLNNSSLIEYLASNCGMSLTKPNFEKKIGAIMNTMKQSFSDIDNNVKSAAEEMIYKLFDNLTSLT